MFSEGIDDMVQVSTADPTGLALGVLRRPHHGRAPVDALRIPTTEHCVHLAPPRRQPCVPGALTIAHSSRVFYSAFAPAS
jgi:hypothetical protein